MEDFLGDLLQRIEDSGTSFSEQAYTVVGQEIMPLLQLMLVAYVGYYGLQLFLGTARIGVSEIVGRIVRMMIILALVSSWTNFNNLLYHWINDTPEDVGRAILAASGTGITEPTNGLSQIWRSANQAASVFAEQSGYFSILPSMIGVLVMVGAGIFIAVALAILILAKVMLWVLIGTAPIFIACMLFERTRGYGVGWFNQVLTYALIPLFIYVVASFLIAAMNPELSKIDAASGSRTLTLADIAGFLLLCAAGAFVMLYVQSIGQGIAGGISAGIGTTARQATKTLGLRALQGGATAGRSAYRGGRALRDRYRWSGDKNSSGIKVAMQTKITQNGTPA
ncbi:type IV secretion system protein [Phyllobacterium endophyticum]|uniref:Conjugal transfer protein TrbL n=1 Tax=Phyllobacterium endophyticum TaxID=1149773 RepID=A0A2P7AQQ6_9HYPH|nr:type IV secretion system protein [Phyllobacterium endophyticum]MBB3236994.1 type IV secretion system protein VirB6 [Phyllobacterium endophyticum]PSH56566.1 conjugal transfer protein TrbL [Phyllobacterium endophyticum]TYR44433.1 type IV secretion system protein [Phyllobacterium endophyticum]